MTCPKCSSRRVVVVHVDAVRGPHTGRRWQRATLVCADCRASWPRWVAL